MHYVFYLAALSCGGNLIHGYRTLYVGSRFMSLKTNHVAVLTHHSGGRYGQEITGNLLPIIEYIEPGDGSTKKLSLRS